METNQIVNRLLEKYTLKDDVTSQPTSTVLDIYVGILERDIGIDLLDVEVL